MDEEVLVDREEVSRGVHLQGGLGVDLGEERRGPTELACNEGFQSVVDNNEVAAEHPPR